MRRERDCWRLTVGDGRVDGVAESAHVRVGGRNALRAADAPRHDAREVRSAARCAGHRAAAVALTRVRVVRRARAQHRRVYRETLRLERAVARVEVDDAHIGVQQHVRRAASCSINASYKALTSLCQRWAFRALVFTSRESS